MRHLIILLFIIVTPALLIAQKNIIPVFQTRLLGIQLPEGSKQDKRLLSVAGAGSFLSMSTEYKNSEFIPVEVYSLPVSSGFTFEIVKNQLSSNGYSEKLDNGDNKLRWFTKNNGNWLVYLSQEAKEINLYIGQGKVSKIISDNSSQPYLTGTQPTQSNSSFSAGRYPAYIPPLAGRQTGNQQQKSVQKQDDLNVVYDLDKNKYNVIKIGEQFWLKENLQTTQYRDTTNILSGLSAQDWSKTKQGAYAVYEDKSGNKQKYGLLYNGYAAVSGKLCPEGWHVATDADWKELELFFGLPAAELERTGERGEIAGKLKTSDDWKPSAFTNNNSSGFSIFPAGSRLDNGEYTTLNQYGNFWTSTVYDDRYGLLYLWNHHVHYNTHAVGRIYTVANNGYSIRCVKDKPKTVKTK